MPPKLTHEEFIKRAHLNPTITLIGQYEGMHEKIEYFCNICKKPRSAKAQDLMHGVGCASCARTQTSFAELFIFFSLKKAGLNPLHRDRKTIESELDIFLPDEKYAIEIGSWYYHKKNHERDLEKVKKCKENEIKLLLIYDCFYDDISFSHEFITTYPFWLGHEKNRNELKNIVNHILKELNINDSFSEEEWNEIQNEAHTYSSKISDEEFKEILKERNKYIELVGKLGPNLSTKARFKCLKCKHEWKTAPINVIRKDRPTGCPKCAGTMAKTHQEFVEECKKKQPGITITGVYKRADKKITYICNHGHTGLKTAIRLLQSGCTKCSNEKKGRKQTKSHEKFTKDLSVKNPNIELIGEYTHNKEPIKCRCKICNKIWNPRAGDLLRGHGCPKCAQKRGAKLKQKKVMCIETEKIYESLKKQKKKQALIKIRLVKFAKARKKQQVNILGNL